MDELFLDELALAYNNLIDHISLEIDALKTFKYQDIVQLSEKREELINKVGQMKEFLDNNKENLKKLDEEQKASFKSLAVYFEEKLREYFEAIELASQVNLKISEMILQDVLQKSQEEESFDYEGNKAIIPLVLNSQI